MKRTLCIIACLSAFALYAAPPGSRAQQQTLPAFPGHWDGAITIGSMKLGIMLDIQGSGDSLKGTIDIPQQLALGLALKSVTQKGSAVHFELPAGPGLALFDGEIQRDTVAGKFRQGSAAGTFRVVRGIAAKDTARAEEPPPYRQEEVRFTSGSITLAGTLTLPVPSGDGSAAARKRPVGHPVPAVVLLTGSGPQNRDEELFGFKPFRIIADFLTRRGIAVLRYDDRGVGGSGGDPQVSTTRDFAGDALAAVRFLAGRTEIDTTRIGLCGHSEGAIAAVIAARQAPRIRFLVLIAGPAVPGEKILLSQIEGIARQQGATQSQINDALFTEQRVFDTLRSGGGWDELRRQMREDAMRSLEALSPEQRSSLGNVDSLVNARVELQIKAVQSPWFKFFAFYDPAPDLAQLHCPVLAFFGGKDMQVPVTLNEQPMRSALAKGGNSQSGVRVLPEANHLFQTAVTGSPMEYATLKKAFVPGFLEQLGQWIGQQAGTGR